MRHDEFVGHVQDRAQLPGRDRAEAAIRATLETLGERLAEQLADHLADQLPQEIGEHMRRTEVLGGAGTGERFGLDEFTRRVAARSRMDHPTAVYASRVVLEVLREATQGGIMDKVRQSLGDELRELVDAGSTGHMRH